MRLLLLVPLFGVLLGAAAPALGQEGLRIPARPAAGIDPSYAGGWLSPERTHLGFQPYHWRDSIGFAPVQRMQWSYNLGARSSVGMSVANVRDFITEPVYGAEMRQYGLIGRYSFTPDWSFSAESLSRDPNSLFRLQDFRIGVRRQF